MAGNFRNTCHDQETKIGNLTEIFGLIEDSMTIVTITSDWSNRDYYSGMLKGKLLGLIRDIHLVDINQEIKPFKTIEGAFLMRQVLGSYPPQSIHLYMVNQGNRPDVFPVILKHRDNYMIGWEDAGLGLIVDEEPELCVRITPEVFGKIKLACGLDAVKVFPSFPALGIFPVLACALSRQVPIGELGQHDPGILQATPWLPAIQDSTISGRIVYIDSYGNAISNISKSLFDRTVLNRRFDIFLISNHYRINRINTGYLETEPGDMMALFNSVDLLEVAVVHGNITTLLGLEPGSAIKVKVYE